LETHLGGLRGGGAVAYVSVGPLQVGNVLSADNPQNSWAEGSAGGGVGCPHVAPSDTDRFISAG
jgi:hypothetical protein